MSAAQFSNGLGTVRIADRDHINPILHGILYTTDRKAQVAVLKQESRRSSLSSSSSSSSTTSSASSVASSAPLFSSFRKSSVVSPDAVTHAVYSKDKKRSKSSLFGMASFGKNRGVPSVTSAM